MLKWTPERVQSFWDFESRYPERFFTYAKGPALVRRLRPYLARAESVLDFGCGPGHLLDCLLASGYRAGGTDASPNALAVANERLAGREGFLGANPVETLLADGRRFDRVLVVEVVEHLYDDAFDQLADALHRLVRPGGLVVFTTPNEERLEDELLRCPSCEEVFHRWQHVRSWSAEGLTRDLTSRGFEVVEAFTAHLGLSLARRDARWKALGKRVVSLLRPGMKRPSLLVVARPASP